MSFNRYNVEDTVISSETVVTPMWSEGGKLSHDQMVQIQNTQTDKLYWNIYNGSDINGVNVELQFSICYGHYQGFNSVEFYGNIGNTPTSIIYKQLQNLVFGDENSKFKFNNERPYTMVRRTIDANWTPFWPAPPFPGFPSGHATQSGAVAAVLTDLFGQNFAFTDDTHVGRPKDARTGVEFKARLFKSFDAFATESALSRLYGGIHTRQDNETGLAEGKKIAKNILALKFKK